MALNYVTLFKAINDRLTNNWSTLPVVQPNDDGSDKNLTNGFVQLNVRQRDSRFATINGYAPTVFTFGSIDFNIFTEQNTGVGEGLTYATEISDIFRGAVFDRVYCYETYIDEGDLVEYSKGMYWLTPLRCMMKYDTNVTLPSL